MANSIVVPLLSNILINDLEKFELFKVTVLDASKIFDEAHFKIRGCFAKEAVDFLTHIGFTKLYLYQELQEYDWISATIEMLEAVTARSVFLYFEDHKLVAPLDTFKSVIYDFEKLSLDYLCYSFFRASNFGIANILPFYVTETDNIIVAEFESSDMKLLGKISPKYHTFSLLSLVSVIYLKSLLAQGNTKLKLYSKRVTGLLWRLYPYPQYKKVLGRLNSYLKKINMCICIYDPSSPFNLEKIWFEFHPFNDKFKVGKPRKELFANYDDDNGADGESLIKRGLYPFTSEANINPTYVSGSVVTKMLELSQNQHFKLLYHSAAGRIRKPPIICIKVKAGSILLRWPGNEVFMGQEDLLSVYSNKETLILAQETTVLELRIFDELF